MRRYRRQPVVAGQQVRPPRRLTDVVREAQTLYTGVAEGNGVVVHRLLREQGRVIGLRTVQRAVAPVRQAQRAADVATVRVETAPGAQLQIDFGEKRVAIGGTAGAGVPAGRGPQGQRNVDVLHAVWDSMRSRDPYAAAWGSNRHPVTGGLSRWPTAVRWGWGPAEAAAITVPVLVIGGIINQTVPPSHLDALYGALSSNEKVGVRMDCASHASLWEGSSTRLLRPDGEDRTRPSRRRSSSG